MGIDRSSSTSEAFDARQARDAEATDRARAPQRERPSPEQAQKFQELLHAKGKLPGQQEFQKTTEVREGAAGQAEDGVDGQVRAESVVTGVHERESHGDDAGGMSDLQSSTDASLLWQAQAAVRDGSTPQAAPPPQVNPNAFAEMLEKHVRQLAVSEGGTGDGDGRVLLRLSDQTLPGTDLLLTRTASGWSLRADVRSRESFDAIRDAAPRLAERFAERNLGELTIEPVFHG